MIPKVVHYCWFGGNPLPDSALKCIASWQKFLPGYEVKQWNEDNFDVNIIPYTAEAYEAKKYAFVSDYARFWILYHHGGLYFDTDVEVIKPMDDIIAQGSFMGIETMRADGYPLVNPGQGLRADAGHPIYQQLLKRYADLHFKNVDGTLDTTTVVHHTTEQLIDAGLQPTDKQQDVSGIRIYPRDYFNPLDDLTGRLVKTANTRSIHWYSRTWSDNPGWRVTLSRWSHRVFGLHLHNLRTRLGF